MQSISRRITLQRPTSTSSKSVLTEMYKAILGSNIKWRGRSYAASAPSISSQPKKAGRLPRKERRAIVESFVEEYRASNAGKFPLPSHVREQTGGSYYCVKLIVEELVYNHKHSSSSNITGIQVGKVESEKEQLSVSEQGVEQGSTMHEILEGHPSNNNVKVTSDVHKMDVAPTLSEKKIQIDEQDSSGQEPGAYSDNTHILEADISTPLKSEVTVQSPSSVSGLVTSEKKNVEKSPECLQKPLNPPADISTSLESGVAAQTPSSVSQVRKRNKRNVKKAPECLQKPPSVDVTEHRGTTKKEELNSDQGEPSTVGTGLWGNLKSLADGIFTFWRKK